MKHVSLGVEENTTADRVELSHAKSCSPLNLFYRAGRTPLWGTPDLHDPDARSMFTEALGALRGRSDVSAQLY